MKQIKTGSQIWKNSNIIYTEYQNYNLLGNIDSADKQLCFLTENEDDQPIFVSYTSHVPENIVKKQREVNRIKILFCISIFERLKDGSTYLQTYCQFDAGRRLRRENWDQQVN